jgi:glycosyltransferase involved in cell wall biosynthesis
MEPKKMLALFDYNSFTGFATVSRNLIREWKKTFRGRLKIDIVGINYFGEDYSEDEDVRVISAKKKDVGGDDFGRHVFLATLMKSEYDFVFIMQDLGVVVPMLSFFKKIRLDKIGKRERDFKSIYYFPVDFSLNPRLVEKIEFFNALYTYTEFGRQAILRHRPELKDKLRVVPHGTNMTDFFPMELGEKEEFRKAYFGKNADKFIVGCVNRNQSRKDIPTTIFGFLEFWETNKNSFLYLHMNPKDPLGWDLRLLLSQTPLREGKDFMFPSEDDYNKGAEISKLNKIYNSMDVFMTTATGGGWELTVTEAMTCKVPTIIPKHTSFEALGGEKGERTYYLTTLYPIAAMTDNIIRFQSDLYEIGDLLAYVHKEIRDNTMEHKTKLWNAYDFVSSLKWEGIAKEFSDEIQRLLKMKNP